MRNKVENTMMFWRNKYFSKDFLLEGFYDKNLLQFLVKRSTLFPKKMVYKILEKFELNNNGNTAKICS